MSVGRRIKERRLELKMSADELAKKLNKNRATIYRYEKGEIENLPLDILEPLAKALDTTPAYLMGWSAESVMESSNISSEDQAVYLSMNKSNIRYFENWYKTFNGAQFTEEEHEKLIEYGKFLLSQREK